MTRLERAARWRLPPQEAEDVIADYRDIVGDPPRPDEELRRDVGNPRDVVKPLTQPRQYHVWLAVFAAMAACLLLPAVSPLPFGLCRLWYDLFYSDIPGFYFYRLFLIVGPAISLIWFRPRKGEKKAPLPRAILITLAALLVLIAGVWWIFWQITLYPGGALASPIFRLPITFWWPLGNSLVSGNLVSFLLEWIAVPLAAVGMAGLVKARVRDRRWRAVYVLSLSALLLAFRVLSVLFSMDPTATLEYLFTEAMPTMIEITAVGLLGTGVALC